MASTPTLKPETDTAESPNHAPKKTASLTPEYRKAHKNYVLVAALLASWELIGINLNTKDKWGIELTSPRAVPLILFTLLVYSAYKLVIEWNLEDDPTPKSKRARIDYFVAHAIGASAVLIGVIQTTLRVRVVDFVLTLVGMQVFLAFFLGMVSPLVSIVKKSRLQGIIYFLIALSVLCYQGFVFTGWWGVLWVIVAFGAGIAPGIFFSRSQE